MNNGQRRKNYSLWQVFQPVVGWVLILLWCFGAQPAAFGQWPPAGSANTTQKRLRQLEAYARKTPQAYATHPARLANYLAAAAQTPTETVYAFYVWVAHHISYDMKAFLAHQVANQQPYAVLASKTAVCQGYSNLMQVLCAQVGIDCRVVSGYSKGYGYVPGQQFAASDHAWNAVLLNSSWHLLDVTWAARQSNRPDLLPARPFSRQYFLTEPAIFRQHHLPEDPLWQLCSPLLSLPAFEAGQAGATATKKLPGMAVNAELALPPGQQQVNSYTRIRQFNPRHKTATYWLAHSWLFRALDTLSTVHAIEYPHALQQMPFFEQAYFAMFDSAANYLAQVPPNAGLANEVARLNNELLYQRGVFYYEAGMQLYNTIVSQPRAVWLKHRRQYYTEMNCWWDVAIGWLNQVPPGTFYYDDAQEYIHDYIGQNRP